MSLSPYQFQLLNSSSKDICNEFEHFYTYFNLLIKKKLHNFIPTMHYFDHREKIYSLTEHLTSQQSIWLYIENNRHGTHAIVIGRVAVRIVEHRIR